MLKGLERYNFFCDMDGVLADFDRLFTEQTGLRFSTVEDEKGSAVAWGMVKAIDDFWLRLQPMADMHELWRFIQPYRPILLSSPGKHDTARAMLQKRTWASRMFGEHQPIIFSSAVRKAQYARSNAIIIDDWGPTIERWVQKGGIAIHHTSAKDSIEKIRAVEDSVIVGDIFDHIVQQEI